MALYLACLDCGVGVSVLLYQSVSSAYDSPSRLLGVYKEAIRYYKERVKCSRLSIEEKERLIKEADRSYINESRKDRLLEERDSKQTT